MFGFFKSPLGVDLGASSLKVVQVQGKTVSVAAVVDIEERRHDAAALGNQLEGFFKSLGLEGKPAVVNLPGAHAFIRTVTLPKMPAKELKEALMWEVKKQLPYPLEEVVFDYVSAESGEHIAVTYAASEKYYAEAHIAPLKAAGLDVVALDINPLCLLRTIRPATSGNVVVLDMGAMSTEIHIVKNGILRITRAVGTGGPQLRRRLVLDGLSEEEAERVLKEGSREELSGPLSEISLEVSRSIDFYKANFKEKTIAEIILVGGVSLNPGVRDFFSEAFGLSVSVPDPFKDLRLADEGMRPLGPLFAIAAGLARRQS